MAETVRSSRVPGTEEDRERSIDLLNTSLADTLYAKMAAKFSHWNVKGAGFYPAHLLFDKVAESLEEASDIIAERITALGGNAEGTIEEVFQTSQLSYSVSADGLVKDHMRALADLLGRISDRYQVGIRECPDADLASQDVFITLTRDVDKLIYFVETDLRSN